MSAKHHTDDHFLSYVSYDSQILRDRRVGCRDPILLSSLCNRSRVLSVLFFACALDVLALAAGCGGRSGLVSTDGTSDQWCLAVAEGVPAGGILGDWTPSGPGMMFTSRALSAGQSSLPLEIDYMGAFVPATGRITGIVIELKHRVFPDAADAIVDESVRLRRGVQRQLSEERSSNAPWPVASTWVTYGGPNDTWGQAWNPDDIVFHKLELRIAVAHTAAAGTHSAVLESVRYKVHYRCE